MMTQTAVIDMTTHAGPMGGAAITSIKINGEIKEYPSLDAVMDEYEELGFYLLPWGKNYVLEGLPWINEVRERANGTLWCYLATSDRVSYSH